MKLFNFLLLIFFINNIAVGQDLNFEWVKEVDLIPSPWYENDCIAVDANKNLYMAGNFEYTKDFDPGPATFNLASYPDPGMYISKLDSFGNFLWAKSLPGKKDNFLRDLVVDEAGNMYCSGNFKDTTDFDPGPGTHYLISDILTEYNGFLAKYNADGEFQWAIKLNGNGTNSLALDKAGNIYTCGTFLNNEDIDPGPGVITSQIVAIHMCVRKFDNNGNFTWAKMLLCDMYSKATRIKLDKDNNIYVEGTLEGAVDFDPGIGVYKLRSSDGSYNSYFVCKLDAAGDFKWAKVPGGGSIQPDDQGNLIRYGGNGSVTKYDANGDMLWTKTTGGVPKVGSNMDDRHLVVDKFGSIYVCGIFTSTRDFDPGPGVFNMTANTATFFFEDMFISKLDANGNFVWAKQIGGEGPEISNQMIVDESGSLYITGNYGYTVDFDPGPGIHNMTHYPGATFFLKLNPCTTQTDTTLTVNTCDSFTLNNVTYDTSGIYTQVLRNVSGCDSFIIVKLTINKTNTYQNIAACKEFSFNNRMYTSSGLYTDTLTSSNGCDSIVHLNLLIKAVSYNSVNITICEGQNYFGHTSTGSYTDTLTGANGCDSIRTVNLVVSNRVYKTVVTAVCDGDNYFGHVTSGVYIDTLKAASGCDSIRTVNLTVYPKKTTTIYQSICKGQNYAGHSSSGIYYDTLVTYLGCDSTIAIHLTVNPLPKPYLGNDRNICYGQMIILNPGIFKTYSWQDSTKGNNFTATAVGTYTVYVIDTNLCSAADTIRITRMDTIPRNFLPADKTICSGKALQLLSGNYQLYQWNTGEQTPSITITEPGRYFLTVKDFNNCTGIDTVEIIKRNDCIPISIPNAFSPNADGNNDFFKPTITQEVAAFTMEIYNRFGQKLFETRNIVPGWDGKYKGTLQNSGAYIYRIYFKNESGYVYDKKGTFILLR
jgi:gliding motility-associated-like protein